MHSKSRKRRFEAGAALVTAMAFTLVVSMMIAGVLTYAAARRGNVYAKKNSEQALLLAEAGVNDELAYIVRHQKKIAATTIPYGGGPTIATGEPYKGRKGSVPGVDGNYWVFTCVNSDGTGTWSGKGSFYVIANARVNGAWRQVKIRSAVGGGGSPLELYAVFAVNSQGGASNAITLSGSNSVIQGTVGTNGKLSNNESSDLTGNNWLDWTQAQNCNTADTSVAGSQFVNTTQVNPGDPIYTLAEKKIFPTVTNLMKQYYVAELAAAGQTDPWAWMSANNDNNLIRVFNTTGAALTNAGTQLFGSTRSQKVLFNGNNFAQDTLIERFASDTNSFQSVPAYSGATIELGPGAGTGSNRTLDDIVSGDKCLIFPPGDYFFNRIELGYLAQQKIVIDDAWLTSSNSALIGNPNKKQVRFYITSGVNSNDFVEIPITFTSSGGGDPAIFRFMYNKENQTFTFHRGSGFPDSAGNLTVFGAVYCVTGATQPTSIKFWGESANSTLAIPDRPYVELRGSLIADNVVFQGYGKIVFSTTIYNPDDILVGLEDWGSYDDSGT